MKPFAPGMQSGKVLWRLPAKRGEHGFVCVAVVTLMLIMTTLVVGNSRVLHQLRKEIRWIEQRHRTLLAFSPTNAPAGTVTPRDSEAPPRQ